MNTDIAHTNHRDSRDPRDSRTATPGHKAVLVSEAAFRQLKSIQSWKACEQIPVRFDLKDIATAFVEEAMAIPGFRERVLQRALANVTSLLTTTKKE